MTISQEEKDQFGTNLDTIMNDLRKWINKVHLMAGPDRLEIERVVIERRPNVEGDYVEITAEYFIGDIISACNVLRERLKG